MKVLLPIDGSQCCQASLNWMTQFLVKTRDQICLLHVIPILPGMLTSDLDIQNGMAALEDAKNQLTQHGFTVLQSEYQIGDPVNTICEYANQHQVNQIILGSHGYTGLSKLLLGSVSEGVLKHAQQPVMIINNRNPGQLTLSHAEATLTQL